MPLAPSEQNMWDGDVATPVTKLSSAQLDERYEKQSRKLVLEQNREKLQNFYEALRRPGYMNLQPFFQRRPRWNDIQKSRFIESFILNIPVPPLFLFEIKSNSYEVIDGQQRIRAIQDFFSGDLALTGLVHWPELDGLSYTTLPAGVRAGIERRSISYTIVMRESASNEEDATFIKQTVFERLNTGGAKMTAQEIRNSIFASGFNDMMCRLTEWREFRQVWAASLLKGKPKRSEKQLVESMGDVEQVLRFFAFRHTDQMKGPAGRFLSAYMLRAKKFDEASLTVMEDVFRGAFSLAVEIYASQVFCEYNPEKKAWGSSPRKAIADAQLVALSELLVHRDLLIAKKAEIVLATQKLFEKHPLKLLRKHGTADAVRDRIQLFTKLYQKFAK